RRRTYFGNAPKQAAAWRGSRGAMRPRRLSLRRLSAPRRYGDITYLSLLAIILSSTLMHDGGGTLKPYEVRELHAMWDDFVGNEAAAAELRRDEPRRPWTAPSLSKAAENTADLTRVVTPTEPLVLLGGPLPDGPAIPEERVQTASASDLDIP